MGWNEVRAAYEAKRPFTVLTCYDHPSAVLQDAAGIDVIFVGDSVGTNVLGYASEREVTLGDMAHHVAAVRRGVRHAAVMADLPYGTYRDPSDAAASAQRLLAAGAEIIKMEEPTAEVVAAVSNLAVPVCVHLGYTPQTKDAARVQAKDLESARQLFDQAFAVRDAGADMLLIELVPAEVASMLTDRIGIPTIGIGAGPGTSAQVQVLPDILGLSEKLFRHARSFADLRPQVMAALSEYRRVVEDGSFPEAGVHARQASAELLAALRAET